MTKALLNMADALDLAAEASDGSVEGRARLRNLLVAAADLHRDAAARMTGLSRPVLVVDEAETPLATVIPFAKRPEAEEGPKP